MVVTNGENIFCGRALIANIMNYDDTDEHEDIGVVEATDDTGEHDWKMLTTTMWINDESRPRQRQKNTRDLKGVNARPMRVKNTH